MANFIRQIVGGGVSFSSNAIGWETPTSVTPQFASFFDGSYANLGSGSASSAIGTPVFVSGTSSEIPYMNTSNYLYGVNTEVSATPDLTIMALYRMPTPTGVTAQTGNIVSNWTGSYTTEDPVQIEAVMPSTTSAWIHGFANTASGGIVNNVNVSNEFTTWQVIAIRIQRSVLAQNMTVQSLTQGLTANVSVTNTSALTVTGNPLIIGTDTSSGNSNTGVGHFGFVGIWQSVLSDADVLAMYELIQKRALRYGVTV